MVRDQELKRLLAEGSNNSVACRRVHSHPCPRCAAERTLRVLAPALAQEVLDRRRDGEALAKALQLARLRNGLDAAEGHSVLCPKFSDGPGNCNCGLDALMDWLALEQAPPEGETEAPR